MRALLLLLAFAASGWAENFRLYLKDGGFHVVREYQVLEDRVRYYSVERSDWEEIPTGLVDLKRTEGERKTRADEFQKRAAMDDAEEKFERAMAREIASVPVEPGLYLPRDGKIVPLKMAELRSTVNRKQSILKILSPIPIIPGKTTLELDGPNSALDIPDIRPTFYFRLGDMNKFGIVRLTPSKNGRRQVGVMNVEPMTKQIFFELQSVDVFRQQVKGDLYKVWPSVDLTPGEYAFVQSTEEQGWIQLWDFRVPSGAHRPE
jgi:hypothetical protein